MKKRQKRVWKQGPSLREQGRAEDEVRTHLKKFAELGLIEISEVTNAGTPDEAYTLKMTEKGLAFGDYLLDTLGHKRQRGSGAEL